MQEGLAPARELCRCKPRLRCSRTESVTQESALKPGNCRYKLKVCSCSCALHCVCLPSGHTLFKRRKKINKEKKKSKTKRLCSIWRTICIPVVLVAGLKARSASAAPQPFLRPGNCRIPAIRSGITAQVPSGEQHWDRAWKIHKVQGSSWNTAEEKQPEHLTRPATLCALFQAGNAASQPFLPWTNRLSLNGEQKIQKLTPIKNYTILQLVNNFYSQDIVTPNFLISDTWLYI